MYTLTVILSTCVIYSQAISYQGLIQEQWDNFKLQYGKFYESDVEEQYRLKVFTENLHQINEHNKLYEQNLSSYKMAMNKFGDMSEEEFLRHYSMQRSDRPEEDETSSSLYPPADLSMEDFIIFAPPSDTNVSELTEKIDWRQRGYVTPVKNQGSCGSCWSFSATGSLEGQWFKKTKKLVSLSEQNLMDCSWRYGNKACDGGWADKALSYVKNNGGIDTERSYPYKGRNSRKCNYRSQQRGATVSNVVMVPRGEAQLKIKLANVGPVSIAIAIGRNFRFYHSGVYNNPKCGQKLSHAVLAVGYGTFRGHDYWLVKNSWGRRWGDEGYVKMARNKNNQCGIANEISYPIV